jgi:hypothetical protein
VSCQSSRNSHGINLDTIHITLSLVIAISHQSLTLRTYLFDSLVNGSILRQQGISNSGYSPGQIASTPATEAQESYLCPTA